MTAPPTSTTGPPPRRGWLAPLLKGLGLALGITLLVGLIRAAGPQKVLEYLTNLGGWWLLVLAVSASWFVLNSLGWWFTFRPRIAPLGRLLRIHLVAEAVSNVTPFFALGGEPLKLLLLRDRASAGVALASVVNDNVVHVITAVVFMLLGLAAGVFLYPLPPMVALVLAGAILLFGVGAGLLVWRGQRGLLAPLARLALRLRVPLPARLASELVPRATAVDQGIGAFLTQRRGDFAGCFAAHLGGRLMGAVEAWVVLQALGTPVSLGTALFLIAVMHVLVNLIFGVIPNQLGVQEGAAWLLFASIGLDPSAAVALALVRRIRGFFWIGVGLLLLAISRTGAGSGRPAREGLAAPGPAAGSGTGPPSGGDPAAAAG